jgi:ActD protein
MPGVVAVFRELDATVDAIHALRKERMAATVYSPTIRHELEHALGSPASAVRRFTLIGGVLGCSFGYWIAIWASDYWPLVVGGKAIASWIPYTIFGFEMMVLIGGLSTVAGLFIMAGIPRLTLTVGYDPRFSAGEYGIFVETVPERRREIEELLRRAGAVEVRYEQ